MQFNVFSYLCQQWIKYSYFRDLWWDRSNFNTGLTLGSGIIYLFRMIKFILIQSLPVDTWSACAAKLGNKTLVFGGFQDEEAASSTVALDARMQDRQWQTMPDMNEKRASCSAAVMHGDNIIQ